VRGIKSPSTGKVLGTPDDHLGLHQNCVQYADISFALWDSELMIGLYGELPYASVGVGGGWRLSTALRRDETWVRSFP
jgi:hypothetical protein